MKERVTIEFASADDLGEILALQKLAFQSEAERYGDDSLPPLTQTPEGIRDDFEKMTFLKASIGKRIVGSVRAHLEGGTCFVGRLAVHPEWQNRGIGAQLVRAIENAFGDTERFEIFTGDRSAPALHLYRKLGYEAFKHKEMDTHDLVFLEKRAGRLPPGDHGL